MIEFTELYLRLDATTRTSEKVAALERYFKRAEPADAVWAIHFLMGRRLKRLVPIRELAGWASALAKIEPWLFEECYERVGDLAETVSLLVPPGRGGHPPSLQVLVEDSLQRLPSLDDREKRKSIESLWSRMEPAMIFVLGKMITGGFRVGVSKNLVIRALASQTGLDRATVAHRLMGTWEPTADFYHRLVSPEDPGDQVSRPYPFLLANPLQQPVENLGRFEDWQVEWKWDGIRAQLIKREDQIFIWSRGEEMITDQFPEVSSAAAALPGDLVLDGELVAWDASEHRPLPFSQMQRRLGRKRLSRKLLDEVPVVMLVFDQLESSAADLRSRPLEERQELLKKYMKGAGNRSIFLPPPVEARDWNSAAVCRQQNRLLRTEGLMLKRKASEYRVGRPSGDWWKWKVDPLTVDAVMIYAQRGHGRRASLYSDYTFAVWNREELVPIAKAYSGLTDAQLGEVDAFIRRNIIDRFGPVRSVTPSLVFELAFEKIHKSPRHKSGIALRFPRIRRWRQDKNPDQADHLQTLLEMADDE